MAMSTGRDPQQRLGIDAVIRPGKTGPFEVIADGKTIAERGGNWFTRRFAGGYPDLDSVVQQLLKSPPTQRLAIREME